MKTKKLKERNNTGSGWAEMDVKEALALRDYNREWMNRIRLKDIIADLKLLETHSRHRAHFFEACQLSHVFPAGELATVFQTLEKDQRSLTGQFHAMHEKLGWNLQP